MLIADDSRFGQLAVGKKLPIDQAPILINNDIESIANQLQPVAGKPLHFTLSTKMVNEIRNELMPFFELHDSRYMMYWLALSEDSYKGYLDNLAKQEQERQALEDRTVDKVQPGEQQPESDHFMETDQSFVGCQRWSLLQLSDADVRQDRPEPSSEVLGSRRVEESRVRYLCRRCAGNISQQHWQVPHLAV